jgi:hypothetical protein
MEPSPSWTVLSLKLRAMQSSKTPVGTSQHGVIFWKTRNLNDSIIESLPTNQIIVTDAIKGKKYSVSYEISVPVLR